MADASVVSYSAMGLCSVRHVANQTLHTIGRATAIRLRMPKKHPGRSATVVGGHFGSSCDSRHVELPAGVVLNPTVIAMQQAARERAGKALASSIRVCFEFYVHGRQENDEAQGSDADSCQQIGNVFREHPTSLHEYQDSLYSSSSSIEPRQPAMTSNLFRREIFQNWLLFTGLGQRLPQQLSPSVKRKAFEQEHPESEITQEEAPEDPTEISSA